MSTGTHEPTLPLTTLTPGDGAQRRALVSRARRLTRVGLAWHALEAAVAIAAGVVAGSIALVAFGADSVIEAGAGLVGGGNHPKAANKESVSSAGNFPVQNGHATFSLTLTSILHQSFA